MFFRRRPKYPTVTIEFMPDDIAISADVPSMKSFSPQQADAMAGSTAGGIFVLTQGNAEGVAAFQRALAAAAAHRSEENWAEDVMRRLLRAATLFLQSPAGEERPVVRPTQVLSQSHQQKGSD